MRVDSSQGTGMKFCSAAMGALLLCAGAAVSAADFDYSYLDLGYSRQNHRDLRGGGGYQLDGSYALSGAIFLYGAYKHNSFSTDPVAIYTYKNHSYQLGAGFHRGLTATLDFVARASVGRAYSEVEDNFLCTNCTAVRTSSGYAFTLGLRYTPAPYWELEALVDRDSLGFNYFEYAKTRHCTDLNACTTGGANDPGAAETALSAGARYSLTALFSVGARYRYDRLESQSASAGSMVFHNGPQSMGEWLVDGRWSF